MRGRWTHAVASISALLGLAAIVGSTTHAYATGRYYTEAQARAGETVFHAQCAICHGEALQGKAGPALAGALFLSVSQYQHLNADYLYRFMSKHMPLNAPGSLTKTQYLDALAYILKVNGYPSGRQPLTDDDTRLAQIKIEPTGNFTTKPTLRRRTMYNNTRITLRHLLLASAFCAGTGMAWAAPAATAPASTAPPPPQPATVVDATPVGADVSVTAKQQLGADQDLDNWILYGRTYDNQRFSPLNEITADNIGKLQPVAIIQTGVVGSFENSPIVVNGIMYISTPYDHVLAYDATTGKELWSVRTRPWLHPTVLRP